MEMDRFFAIFGLSWIPGQRPLKIAAFIAMSWRYPFHCILIHIPIVVKSIHTTTDGRDLRTNLANLELFDMPGLTAAIAVVGSAHILLVHVDAHVPEVLEAVVHGHPLRGLAHACKDGKIVSAYSPT